MEATISLVIDIMSKLATVFMAVLAFFAYHKYAIKTSLFGNEAVQVFETLKLENCTCKPFEGGKNKIFPNLIIERKWGEIYTVIYYVVENDIKVVKTWVKKSNQNKS